MLENVYKPRFIRGGAYQFHIIVIFLVSVFSTSLLYFSLQDVDYPVSIKLLQIITGVTNVIAISYSVYVYSVYDRGKMKAIKNLQEKGIKVYSLEEGLSLILLKVEPLINWTEGHKKQIDRLFSEVDLEKWFSVIEKIDVEKLDTLLESWLKNKEIYKDWELENSGNWK